MTPDLTAPYPVAYALLDGQVKLERQFILDQAYLKEGDVAFVGGSLIEGTGNRYSDVDVHVITNRLLKERELVLSKHYRVLSPDRSMLSGLSPDAEVFLIHTVVPDTHVKVDIEYRTRLEVESIATDIDVVFEYACRSLVLLTKYMATRDMAFLHRLFNSLPLAGDDSLTRLRQRVDESRFRYLMYRWKASDFAVLLDLLGAWEQGELVRCADLARENMVTQFHAFTHLCGNTNYHRKWILTYARKYMHSPNLYERFVALLTASAGQTDQALRDYILDTLDLVDSIYAESSDLIGRIPRCPTSREACMQLDDLLRLDVGSYSEMEIAYRKKAYAYPGSPTRAWFQP